MRTIKKDDHGPEAPPFFFLEAFSSPIKKENERESVVSFVLLFYYPSKTSSDGTTNLEHAAASRGESCGARVFAVENRTKSSHVFVMKASHLKICCPNYST